MSGPKYATDQRAPSAVEQLANLLLDRISGPLAERVAKELGILTAGQEDQLPEPLVKPDDVAARLGVNSETIYRWRRIPGFPAINVGGRDRPTYRMRVSEVEAWLRRGRVPLPVVEDPTPEAVSDDD